MFNLIAQKLKLVFKSKSTLMILIINVIVIVSFFCGNGISQYEEYLKILKLDNLAWIIIFPSFIAINKNIIFSSRYYDLSRVKSKRFLFVSDLIVVLITSCIFTLIIFVLPIFIFLNINNLNFFELTSNTIALTLFLYLRYLLLSIIVHLLCYLLFYRFRILQKNKIIYILPIILFFILTLPLEFLDMYNKYYLFLDFTAGRYNNFLSFMTVNWIDIFLLNSHLFCYCVFYIFFIDLFILKKMEYVEDEN